MLIERPPGLLDVLVGRVRVHLEALQGVHVVAQAHQAAQPARVVAVPRSDRFDAGLVSVPHHAHVIDRVLVHAGRLQARRHHGQRRPLPQLARPRLEQLCVQQFAQPFADGRGIQIGPHVQIGAEPAGRGLDASHRMPVARDQRVHRHAVRTPGDLHVKRMHPSFVGRVFQRVGPFAQHEHVGDGLGARLQRERRVRQAHRRHQFGFARQVGACGLAALVKRMPACQQHRHAARAQRVDRAFDEVVMQWQLPGLAPDRVRQPYVARIRHVADRRVQAAVGDQRVGQVRVGHVRVRVEQGGDARRHRVEFDTVQVRVHVRRHRG